jgi:FtsP/CotA-like multicopper oxidase with cupredoxin domain
MGPQPLTYYYNVVEPGTYMYHCHVEATEHMQMGMLGNLYVRPAQNRLEDGTFLGSHEHSNPDWNADPALDDPLNGDTYAYNDGDGTTLYDVEYVLQMSGFHAEFHEASEAAQPLPFYQMLDNYPMLNGRGYPDTADPDPLPAPEENGFQVSQGISSLITATQGQKLLLRISNLGVVQQYTLTTNLGVPMQVVGFCARHYRGAGGSNLYYETNSVSLSGGESIDVIIDTTNVAPGTYFLYTTNLQFLNNRDEDFGGMMTEIVITAP